MRACVIFSLILAAAVASPADVIHLKNGRKIWADHVRENGTHLEYDVGEDSYAIPRSLVENIEQGGLPPEIASSSPGAAAAADVPMFAPAGEMTGDADLPSRVIRDGHVDSDALASLERTAGPDMVATAYFLAGKHEFEHGNLPQARNYLESALRFHHESPTILNYYAAVLVRMGMAKQALTYAEQSTRLAPNSADGFAVLGFAQFASDRSKDAIRSWKHSLDLRPDPMVQEYIAKAERETKAEAEFSERSSSHFTLHYEGKQTSEQLRRQIMMTLDSEYDDLVRQLGVAPRENIAVVLYTQEAFFDVTRAPSWSGAINDGKLRIPVSGLESVNSEMARVLKHELAHSFINQVSHGRCPQWLHEGIAQLIEPKSLGSSGRSLAKLFTAERDIPYNALEGSFVNLSNMQATVAYAESLAAVEYINDTYGMSDLRRILERIGEGSLPEAALRSTIHSDYGHLRDEIGKFLSSKYGQ